MSSEKQQQQQTQSSPRQPNSSSSSLVMDLYVRLALNPIYDKIFLALILICELLLGLAVINNVNYTEIDWIAYMEEVLAYEDGERDYEQIRGGTGPLVYPAGFLYLFSWLKSMTNDGNNLQKAQYLFLGMYLMTQFFVLLLYQNQIVTIRRRYGHRRHHQEARDNSATKKEKKNDAASSSTEGSLQFIATANQIWFWRVAMGIVCLSKRLHSIFLLRLFNDGPTMLLLYLSVWLFTHQRWNLGCIVFSFAVSIKMNVLLFAPGLLLLLLQSSKDLAQVVVWRLGFCCALPQLILGAPFLLTYPVSYLRKAFELDRVFFYKWTVNWKVRSYCFSDRRLLPIFLTRCLPLSSFVLACSL